MEALSRGAFTFYQVGWLMVILQFNLEPFSASALRGLYLVWGNDRRVYNR